MQEESRENKKRAHFVYLSIITVLLILCGLLAWQYWEQRNRANREVIIKEKVFVERDNLKNDLLKLQEEYAILQTNDAKVSAELEEKKAEIAKLLQQAEKYKDNAYIMARLKKETETLRQIMKGYIVTIDSLNTLNINLRAEKAKVASELTAEQGKTQQLTKEKESLQGVVNLAALLKANNVRATGVRLKSGGKKEDDTKKAKRTDKIKVNFDLAENKISKPGARDIYLRVMTPDGKELTEATDESHMFTFNGVRGFYAAKQNISYNNSEMSVKMYAVNADGFIPGNYIIEIYSDEAVIGQTTLKLE